ncbi:Metal-dependent hydrolase [Tumidithrix helvetica PCC 7403]|uniref:metal-dependent hydrolase n=1 Tax=Tumidithrix helvetica TaxID=3457545 RepID=UPI003CABF711
MMSLTHAAIAIAVVSCGVGTADPVVLAVAGLSSQLPDIDTTKSYTGLVFYPIAKWIEGRYAHRTITHSFIASTIVAAIALPAFFWIDLNYYLAIVLGYTMGWFSDVFTKTGVAAFYPKTSRLVIPGNPNARLRTGSPAEYWLLAVAIANVIISCNLISNGSISIR